MNENKQNTTLLTVIAVATLLVAVVGATFAYFTANQSTDSTSEVEVTGGKLAISIQGENNWIPVSDFQPSDVAFARKEFSISANYDVNLYVGFEIYFDYETQFSHPVYAVLTENASNLSKDADYDLTNNFVGSGDKKYNDSCVLKAGEGSAKAAKSYKDLLASGYFLPNNVDQTNGKQVTLNFELALYYPDTGTRQDDDKSATFKGKLRLEATKATPTTTNVVAGA